MKTLKKISIYFPLLMLAACAAEEAQELDSPIDNDTPRIVVLGGSTAPGATRADEFPEPSNLGVCNANKLRILQFRAAKRGIAVVLSSSDLKLSDFFINGEFKSQLDLDLINQLNYRDKWTTSTVTLNFSSTYKTGYAFPAIAYTDTDVNDFELSTSSGYSGTTLKITNAEFTPELYFGRLKPGNNNYNYSDEEGFIYHYNGDISTLVDNNCQLEGSLYRIVSQINVNINDINPNVEKLEMFLSNVPIRIRLWEQHRSSVTDEGSDHGYFYPVFPSQNLYENSLDHCIEQTKVCSASEFKDGNVRLSTFLLPSTQGRTVTIEATIKKPYIENNITLYKDTVISRTLRAAKNYNLDLATSKVYFSEKELPVYKAATGEFMSYSNVRVNVSGSFSEIFSEQSESNVVIEICPYYDAVHKEITIN